jgi:protein required for attachment to host cells
MQRFERLLSQWVNDEELRERWRCHLHEGAPAPGEPLFTPPPLFKGLTPSNAAIELRRASDGGYDIILDGAHAGHETVPWHLDPDTAEPVLIGDHSCREVFDAPAQAIDELEAFLPTSGATPPWRWARELMEDGLIDADFALTPRGRRCLARGRRPAAAQSRRSNFCVILADAARARILTMESSRGALEPTLDALVEVADLTRPERRARDSEVFTDTRPGLRREGAHGPRHGVSDRRDQHRHETDRRFAEQVADEAARIWSGYHACRVLVVASPAMLGLLRPAIARRTRGASPHDIHELDRDLTRLATPAVHDALAAATLLPPRARLRFAGPNQMM